VEWSERAEDLLPEDCIFVDIRTQDEDSRVITITGREVEAE